MQKVSGSLEECRSLNFYLKTFEQKVYDTYHELMRDREAVTCGALKNKLLVRDVQTRRLIPIFQEHNDRMEKLIGKEFAKGTFGYTNKISSIS